MIVNSTKARINQGIEFSCESRYQFAPFESEKVNLMCLSGGSETSMKGVLDKEEPRCVGMFSMINIALFAL